MIILESRLVNEKYVDGYFLTIDDLIKLLKDNCLVYYDGFLKDDKSYIESWLKKQKLKIN